MRRKGNYSLNELKIAVIGIGGVGGYLAGMLLRAFADVTLAARGRRYESILKNGVVLHSDLNGESTGRPAKLVKSPAELGEQDLIFICVKNYSLDEVLEQMSGLNLKKTIVVPVMNGVDPGDRVRNKLNCRRVIDSVIYTVSYVRDDGTVVQEGDFTSLRIGLKAAASDARAAQEDLKLVSDVFAAAGFDYKISEDIELDIWKKYILNCAFNVETAAYQLPIGALRAHRQYAEEYEALIREACMLARRKGIDVSAEYERDTIARFASYAEDATSSLQRDIRDGKRAEVDTFSGYVIREAERLGLDLPVSRKMYQMLDRLSSARP